MLWAPRCFWTTAPFQADDNPGASTGAMPVGVGGVHLPVTEQFIQIGPLTHEEALDGTAHSTAVVRAATTCRRTGCLTLFRRRALYCLVDGAHYVKITAYVVAPKDAARVCGLAVHPIRVEVEPPPA